MTSKKDKDKLKEQEASENTMENKENVEQVADQEVQEDKVEMTELEKLQEEHAELKNKHLRLFAEFENFRRRTQKEKLDLMKTAAEGVFNSLLPVLDDFDRAKKAMAEAGTIEEVVEGQNLIQQKFTSIVESKGLKRMDSSIGGDFDTDFHEAITQIPAPDPSMKGKIIDEVECGYLLNEKVIRFAKVVVGQ